MDAVKNVGNDAGFPHLHEVLGNMCTAFKAYFLIESYANTLDKKIYNITPDSFIDAFKRLDLNNNT